MRGIAAATGRLRSAAGLAYAAPTHTGASRLIPEHASRGPGFDVPFAPQPLDFHLPGTRYGGQVAQSVVSGVEPRPGPWPPLKLRPTLVAQQVAGTRSGFAGPILSVGEPAGLQRQAATADALGQSGLQPL